MKFLSKWRARNSAADSAVEVSEKNGVRSLHLGSTTVQSAMRIAAPNELELAYTRSMMAFLLFHPRPRRVLMVGLGGGSLAKFVYHRLPSARTVVVEINPQVVAAARAYFCLPPDDERLAVTLGEGGAYVVAHPSEADVLMVDGFDGSRQVESLASQAFYDACAAALEEDGILVANLWGNDSRFDAYLSRIEASFGDAVLCLPAEKRGNVIVLALKKSPGKPRWDELRARAKELEAVYGLEFLRFVEALRVMNPCSERRLLV